MASPVFEIRFKNTEQFNIENQSEFKLLPKEKFEKFELSLKNHKIYVLNPNSKILIASFVGEHLKYGYDQNEK